MALEISKNHLDAVVNHLTWQHKAQEYLISWIRSNLLTEEHEMQIESCKLD